MPDPAKLGSREDADRTHVCGQYHFEMHSWTITAHDLHRLHAENVRLRAALARAIKELVGTTAQGGDAESILRNALDQGEKP